jgi:hypothetical protein
VDRPIGYSILLNELEMPEIYCLLSLDADHSDFSRDIQKQRNFEPGIRELVAVILGASHFRSETQARRKFVKLSISDSLPNGFLYIVLIWSLDSSFHDIAHLNPLIGKIVQYVYNQKLAKQ